MNDKKAIVLGGTSPHVSLIKKLQNRGYYVILIDYLENPPAKEIADEHILESTLNLEGVLEIAKKINPSLVISTSIDQANVTACYVSEKLKLPIPYSYQIALDVTDKNRMKEIFVKSDIPTSPYIEIDSYDQSILNKLKFPLVVKPSDSTGSKGVVKVENESEIIFYLNEALKISRNNKAIIEEFIEGNEYQVDFFVDKKKQVSQIMSREKINLSLGQKTELQNIGSHFPEDLSQIEIELLKIANKIVEVFKLSNTPFFIQFILSNGQISVLEFAVRIGGGLSYSIIHRVTGFDILEATIDSFLGRDVDISISDNYFTYATRLLYSESGKFEKIEGYEELLKCQIIEEFYLFKKKGDALNGTFQSGSRVAAVLFKAKTKDNLEKKIKTAMKKLKVVSSCGEDLLIRSN